MRAVAAPLPHLISARYMCAPTQASGPTPVLSPTVAVASPVPPTTRITCASIQVGQLACKDHPPEAPHPSTVGFQSEICSQLLALFLLSTQAGLGVGIPRTTLSLAVSSSSICSWVHSVRYYQPLGSISSQPPSCIPLEFSPSSRTPEKRPGSGMVGKKQSENHLQLLTSSSAYDSSPSPVSRSLPSLLSSLSHVSPLYLTLQSLSHSLLLFCSPQSTHPSKPSTSLVIPPLL